MAYILTIDQGNSSVKLTLIESGNVVLTSREERFSLESVDEICSRYKLAGAVYCSVAHLDARTLESLSRLIQPAPLLLFTHTSPLPIKLLYRTPQTLGLDRIAAAVAVAAMPEKLPALVVDAGTAITSDVVGAKGEFLGGNISPGMLMRFRALHNFTGRLPIVSSEGPVPQFGYDTATAIRSGVIRGAVAEIKQAYADAVELHGVKSLIITGGAAPTILANLSMADGVVTHIPDLLALGLEKIFQFNYPLHHQ